MRLRFSPMQKIVAGLLGLGGVLLVSIPTLAQPTDQLPAAFDFQSRPDLVTARDNAVVAWQGPAGVPNGRALLINFPLANYPNAYWSPGVGQFWNFANTPTLAIDLANPGTEPVNFNIRVDDDQPVWTPVPAHTLGAGAVLAAGASTTYFLDLAHADDPMNHGMQAGPPVPARNGMTQLLGSGVINPAHVIGFQIFVHQPDSPKQLRVNAIRLLPAATGDRYAGIVDQWGQYTGAEWPGKVHADADLKAAFAHPDQAPNPVPLDQYGGWLGGPTLPATGFFSTVQWQGKWWFVTPAGHLFLSLGVVDPNLKDETTTITGRESMFTGLPSPDGPLGSHYANVGQVFAGPYRTGKTFNFYTANLERKYGPDYASAWFNSTAARLQSWGFNTVSWDGSAAFSGHIPFTLELWLAGGHARIPNGGWTPVDDPFDPKFQQDMDNLLDRQTAAYKNDPWCIGYMVGNEISWGNTNYGGSDRDHYSLAIAALALDARSNAKQAFIMELQAKYGDIGALNAAWRTNFANWDKATAPYTVPATLTDGIKADLGTFLAADATQWFQVVHQALQKVAPHQLFLGCRFAQFNPEAVQAAAKECDVLSFNVYEPELVPSHWKFLSELNKPAMITEFSFGSLDSGLFHAGLVDSADQTGRAQMYRNYINSMADNPSFIGAHWFEYVDEPVTGRSFDGENANLGLVSVTDRPYPELTEAARSVNFGVYARRTDH